MDRRVEQAYLGPSHRYYEEGSSRTPSPMSSPHTSRTPSPPTLLRQLDLPPIVPSQAYLLPRLSPAHSHYGPPPPRVNTSPLLVPPLPSLPHPLLPMPSPPLYNASPMRPSAKVVEEVDDEPHDLINSRFALDKAGATSSLTMVPTHPPMEEEILASKPDTTIAASNHDKAIGGTTDPYWSGRDLDFSTDAIFAYSSRANLDKMLWEDALLDAQKVQ